MDIKLQCGDSFILVDVTIVNPACSKYGEGSAVSGGAAAIAAEERKCNYYHEYLLHQGIHSRCFIPFVLECTGRFGVVANTFLDDLLILAGSSGTKCRAAATVSYFKRRMRELVFVGNSISLSKAGNSVSFRSGGLAA
jgi:hypothetical protein